MTQEKKHSGTGQDCPKGYKSCDGYRIPKEWHIVRFDSLFSRVTRKNDENNQNVLTISAQQGLISQIEYYNTLYASENKTGYTLLHRGDFSYNKSYSSGYAYGAIKRLDAYEKGIVSPLYLCFTPRQGVNSDFYLQYFEAGCFDREIYKIAQEGARNHGLLNVSTEDFFHSMLVFPPLEEQERITEILTQCDHVIELKEQKLDELKQLKKEFLRKMFPAKGCDTPEIRFPGFTGAWEQRKLGNISDFITKGATPTTYGFSWESSGIPFFRNDSIKNNVFVFGEFSYISEAANEALKRSEVQEDDILIAITGEIGKVGIIPASVKKANINQHTARIRIHKDALPYFVYQYLASDETQKEYQKIKTGISMPQLSLEQVRKIAIRIPEEDEQKRITECLSNLDTLITLHQRELEETKTYKKTLAKLLLTGIVRVQG